MLYLLVLTVLLPIVWFIYRAINPRCDIFVEEVVDGVRRRYRLGYLTSSKRFYDITRPFADRFAGTVEKQGEHTLIRIRRGDDPADLYLAGFVDAVGQVFAGDSAEPSWTVSIEGRRHWYELWLRRGADVPFGDEEPVGYVAEFPALRSRKPGETTLLATGAAVLMLYLSYLRSSERREGEPARIPDSVWDTCLPASIVFAGLYFAVMSTPVFRVGEPLFPLLGASLSFAVGMTLVYAATWAVFHFVKLTWLSSSDDPLVWLQMLNRTTGLGAWKLVSILLSLTALGFSLADGTYAYVPLFLAIFLGFVVSGLSATAAPWEVAPRSRPVPRGPQVPEAGPQPGSDAVTREYEWGVDTRAGTDRFRTSVWFAAGEIERVRAENPFGQDNEAARQNDRVIAARLVREGETARQVRTVAEYLIAQGLVRIDEIQAALAFVQNNNIAYVLDSESPEIGNLQEYFRFPAETLYDKRGDCDCKSVLAAAIMRRLGHPVLLLLSDSEGHAAIAVGGFQPHESPAEFCITHRGRNYYFCETTGDNWQIGAVDDSARRMMSDRGTIVDLSDDLPRRDN